MTLEIVKRRMRCTAVLATAAAIAFFGVNFRTSGQESTTRPRIKLNQAALEHARWLIDNEMFVNDKKGSWREHRPSADDENEYIRQHGFDEYAKWYLGIDESRPEGTKARYKFPYGDFNNGHRCAVLAVQNRARQYNHIAIEQAAVELARTIDEKAKR
jgi:hypothetical protein